MRRGGTEGFGHASKPGPIFDRRRFRQWGPTGLTGLWWWKRWRWDF